MALLLCSSIFEEKDLRLPLLTTLRVLASAILFHSAVFALAQKNSNAVDNAAGYAVCSSILLLPVLFIVLNIALLVWIARDAKARGMANSALWMLLVFFTNIVGLIIYLFARTRRNLVPVQTSEISVCM
jgi:cytochrome bd-type quinol oxidase subunit 2